MRLIYILFSSVIFAFIYNCAPVQTAMDYDRQINFSEYKSFSFYQKGLDSLKLNDLDKQRIIQSIEKDLVAKGLQKSESSDLIINISATSKIQVDVNQDIGYGFGWGYGYSPWFGLNYSWVTEREVGKIVIDMIDSKTNKLVWQGIGSGLNISRLEKKEELINEAVTLILQKYPPK